MRSLWPWRLPLFLLALVTNLIGLYAPRAVVANPDGVRLDLLGHAASFALLAAAGLWIGWRARWWLPALTGHAALSELIQHVLMPGRTGDPVDLIADCVGIGLGTATVWALRRGRRRSTRRAPLEADR